MVFAKMAAYEQVLQQAGYFILSSPAQQLIENIC